MICGGRRKACGFKPLYPHFVDNQANKE